MTISSTFLFDKGFNGTVVNLVLPSLPWGSLEIILIQSLSEVLSNLCQTIRIINIL